MANHIDQELIVNYVCQATREVFTTMLGLEVAAGAATLEKTSLGASDGVMSLIGLAGTWTGGGSILCSPEFACRISSRLFMTEYAEVDHEVLDAVAEVTNMIIGNFKSLLEADLGPLGLSIPSVIYGRNFTARSAGGAWTVIPFTCGPDKIEVRVCLTPTRTMARPAPVVAEAEETLAARP